MLEARNVNYQTNNKTILNGINFHVVPGQILGVLGPNGAGKTTLLKILSGQIASEKMIYWQNKPVESYQLIDRAKQIAVVNQFNNPVFSLNVEHIVSMGLLPHQSMFGKVKSFQHAAITQAITQVGLLDKRHQVFNTLSGGEQQRALIARAIVQRASLIILDEPINHLDVFYQHQILELLRQLAKKFNLTVVMSLHDLNLAAAYCDHLCLLDDGAMVAQGNPHAVLCEKRLQRVFRTPCHVFKHDSNEHLRVEFYPQRTANE
ncbi:ABC transporter ATP-binding protein [Aliiglaciecola sp. LCG003]|uniref:ABC transporter ATP-binding protein n=1 Tax=Aliiglaciecola sp. LCG003 TaxID=3053655 RepID=UPI0025743F75|nr:ABC transporter ATP-binding protein [Aliiglaciecola sp. LCG003]WJG09005.1 ABC transporter ATP-binding protein [Aliiglaciecola sp. LCG003]